MNGSRKFHKATGPAFFPGEIWYGVSGKIKVEILSVRATKGNHTSDYFVTYLTDPDGDRSKMHEKDCWNFQVRYEHSADRYL